MAKLSLKGAVVTGRSVTRLGYTRNWNAVTATGKVSTSKYGGTLIEVAKPNGQLRSINESSFTGLIKVGTTEMYFSAGKSVKTATEKVKTVLADVVLGKGHNQKVADAKLN